jgi:hypothetical protein
VLTRIVAGEVVRQLGRPQPWLLASLAGAYGIWAGRMEAAGVALGASLEVTPALLLGLSMQTLWLLVVMLPVAAGGALSADMRSGYVRLVLSRGVSRQLLVRGRLVAAWLVSGVVCAAVGFALWFAASWADVESVRASNMDGAFSFLPEMLGRSPASWCITVTLIYATAGAALLSAGLALSALSPAKLVSEIGPTLAVLLLGFSIVGTFWPLNPLERASFLQVHGVAWTAPVPMIAYWLTVTALMSVVASIAFDKGGGVRS